MRSRLGLVLVTVLVASFATVVQPARAQAGDDDVRAKELYRNGEQLYEEGLYEDAVVAWENAYELSKRPLLLYNIANALERIGRWEEALERINQYRAFAPEEERETLNRRMRAIERRLEQKRADEEASLRDRAATTNTGSSVMLQPRSRRSSGPPPGAIALMALGGGGVAAGSVFGGLAIGARLEAQDLCRGVGEAVLCPDTAADALNRDARYSLGADIGLAVGGASLGAGIILAILDQQGLLPRKSGQPLLLPSAGPGVASLTLQGTF